MNFKIDWATHDSAKIACENWHYSKCLPAGKLVKIGVWEDSKFVGVVIYSHGANNNAAKYFSLTQQQCCELTRVALRDHKTSVSRILSISRKFLLKKCPGLKLVFSYSDLTNENHHGGIYQADNWLYLGTRSTSDKGAYYVIKGKRIHGRSARAKYGNEKNFPPGWKHVASQTKHLYCKILDKDYKCPYPILSYPKRASSKGNVVPEFHSGGGGAIPTDALHSISKSPSQ